MWAEIALIGAGSFVLGSMVYVYAFRGVQHYASVGEYLRKSWPMFAPINCLLYLSTPRHARRPILDVDDFPELAPIRAHWQTIRDEVQALYQHGQFESASAPGSAGAYDVGFRTFHKYGWRKFYLHWYGCTHASARRLCPRTVSLLASIPAVNGAMFSLLPPGGQLTPHSDPTACSLRYHLGLSTPNSDDCYLVVDGHRQAWRDGEPLLFDETYLHYARNGADRPRLILMCDIDRPTGPLGRLLNALYKRFMRCTVVPNTPEDSRGLFNRVFAGIAPVLEKTRRLKQTNRPAYLLVKYSVNTTLILLLAAVLGVPVYMLIAFGTGALG